MTGTRHFPAEGAVPEGWYHDTLYSLKRLVLAVEMLAAENGTKEYRERRLQSLSEYFSMQMDGATTHGGGAEITD